MRYPDGSMHCYYCWVDGLPKPMKRWQLPRDEVGQQAISNASRWDEWGKALPERGLTKPAARRALDRAIHAKAYELGIDEVVLIARMREAVAVMAERAG